jgi:hypothetical protein
MLVEHNAFLSWVSRRAGLPKHKDHAQDGETLIANGDQRPAILPWSLYFGWHPSLRRRGHLALPSGRIAAGRLRAHDRVRNGFRLLAIMQKTRAMGAR